ncbi:MAG: hypothetical protein K8S21_13105 [Gemmatimonadetes bacterium]|nr:hypothetical protein [Gemmatimonadota bacterium]
MLSKSAFRQALSEFHDTEPGSLLFGALQVVIGISAVVAAIGLVRRSRWASPSVAIWGVATAALLAVQPLYEPMDSGARWSIWLGAAAVGVAAAGVSWFARGLQRGDAASRAVTARADVEPPAPGLLVEGRQPVEPIVARAPDAHVHRGTEGQDERPHSSRAPIRE